MKGIVEKSKGVLNGMRFLNSLKYIYVTLIRSRIDYGSVGYGSAATSVLPQLDIIQARAAVPKPFFPAHPQSPLKKKKNATKLCFIAI